MANISSSDAGVAEAILGTRGSPAPRIWLINLAADSLLGGLVALAFLRMFEISVSADNYLPLNLILLANALRITLWSLALFRYMGPIGRLSRLDNEERQPPDPLLMSALEAAYRTPLRQAVTIGVLWLLCYPIVTAGLILWGEDIQLFHYPALIATALLSAALGGGGYIGAFVLNSFLLSKIAGPLSIETHRRGLQVVRGYFSFRERLIHASLALALAPTLFFSSMTYMWAVESDVEGVLTRARAVLAAGPAEHPGEEATFFSYEHGRLASLGTISPSTRRWLKAQLADRQFGDAVNPEQTHALSFETRGRSQHGVVIRYQRQGSGALLAFLGFFSGLILLWALLTSTLLASIVAQPVKSLAENLAAIGQHGRPDKDDPIPTYFLDEIGALSISANQMMDRLDEQHEAISAALKELRKKNEELFRASKSKSQFLANMSHELRTPLNAILGFTRIVRRKTAGTLDPRQTKNLKLVESSGHQLLSLVDDLLDFQKIEAGALELNVERLDLAALFEEIQVTLEPAATSKNLRLEVEVVDSPVIKSDLARLRQILINLVGNAIKYSEKGIIQIRAQPVEDGALVSVSDQGIGISEAQLPKIFSPFHQADYSSTRERDGAGLGLAIVASLTQLLGGRIRVESQVGTGSTFMLYMPAEAPTTLAHEPEV